MKRLTCLLIALVFGLSTVVFAQGTQAKPKAAAQKQEMKADTCKQAVKKAKIKSKKAAKKAAKEKTQKETKEKTK